MNIKYTKKMEGMILQRYKGNSSKQMHTANTLLKDFKDVFSAEVVKGMTARKILGKYYSLKKNKPTTYNWPPESPKPKTTTFKNIIFEAMKDSENMTITVKGTEITVVFK